jgi:hypothetical protein
VSDEHHPLAPCNPTLVSPATAWRDQWLHGGWFTHRACSKMAASPSMAAPRWLRSALVAPAIASRDDRPAPSDGDSSRREPGVPWIAPPDHSADRDPDEPSRPARPNARPDVCCPTPSPPLQPGERSRSCGDCRTPACRQLRRPRRSAHGRCQTRAHRTRRRRGRPTRQRTGDTDRRAGTAHRARRTGAEEATGPNPATGQQITIAANPASVHVRASNAHDSQGITPVHAEGSRTGRRRQLTTNQTPQPRAHPRSSQPDELTGDRPAVLDHSAQTPCKTLNGSVGTAPMSGSSTRRRAHLGPLDFCHRRRSEPQFRNGASKGQHDRVLVLVVPSDSENLHDRIREGPTVPPSSGTIISDCSFRRRSGTTALSLAVSCGNRPLRKPGLARALCLRSWQSSSASVSSPTAWRLAPPAAEHTFGRRNATQLGTHVRSNAIVPARLVGESLVAGSRARATACRTWAIPMQRGPRVVGQPVASPVMAVALGFGRNREPPGSSRHGHADERIRRKHTCATPGGCRVPRPRWRTPACRR